MRCIYCLEEGRRSTGIPHVFPEALRANGATLPRGSVCDPCNNYLGRLDLVVASHPLLSLATQFLELPGKGDRVRDRVGNVDRTTHDGGITIPCAKPEEFTYPDGSRGYRISPLFASTFDFLRFRRGLHHIGLNLIAAMDGVERAPEPAFDPVRRYVKEPRRGESWAFGQYVVSLTDVEDVLLGGKYTSTEDEYVWARLFQVVFFLNLQKVGDLSTFLTSTQPPDTRFVEPSYKPPVQPKQGRTRYRLTIFRDG